MVFTHYLFCQIDLNSPEIWEGESPEFLNSLTDFPTYVCPKDRYSKGNLFMALWQLCFATSYQYTQKLNLALGEPTLFLNPSMIACQGLIYINPPASQTLRHQPSGYCRELTSTHSQQPDSNRELTTKDLNNFTFNAPNFQTRNFTSAPNRAHKIQARKPKCKVSAQQRNNTKQFSEIF